MTTYTIYCLFSNHDSRKQTIALCCCRKMFLFSFFKINVFIFLSHFNKSLQLCPREETRSGIKVVWHRSPEASNVVSNPKCYCNDTLITRNCTNNGWIPTLHQIRPCYKVVKHLNTLKCPPGFNSISDKIDKYCFKVGTLSAWNNPCVESGGATAISELTENELESLISSLKTTGYKTFWLPARRKKNFSPVLWQTPGPNWGQLVSVNNYLPFKTSLLKNCLLFDIVKKILVTEICSERHARFCLYVNDLSYSSKCSKGYLAFKHILDEGKCFGIEHSDTNLSYYDFLNTKCKSPMGTNDNIELKRLIFSKMAEINNLPNNVWCWFSSYSNCSSCNNDLLVGNITESLLFPEQVHSTDMKSIINNVGITALLNSTKPLSCMACEANVIYDETDLTFEYNPEEKKLFLTVYSPSGLFKYNENDKGIQCFSDAKGFLNVVNVYESISVVNEKIISVEHINTERSLFVVDLVTDRSARYWCEGHTKNLSLISTKKIVVNPHGKKIHVFSLVLKMYILLCDIDNVIQFELDELIENITDIFKAEKVLLMDVLDYSSNILKVLLHIHLPINDTEHESSSIVNSYTYLKIRIDEVFPDYNYTFVNLSSSIYCLPSMSQDSIVLLWELTPIGHIASPKQFCLQSNGLPVNRNCHGSYLLGSVWGAVNGKCDINYEPSVTTTLLYNFVHGKMSNDFTSHFLTAGLEFIFNDTNIIIPADIYYLSKSFQNILSIVNQNATSIDIGDIDNIAWIMDRLMVLDEESLHLAQTLNSTNAILDSINNFIAMITKHRLSLKYRGSINTNEYDYRIAIQPRFIVQVSYVKNSNVTGLAIINTSISNKFTEMKIVPLYKNTTVKEVLSMKNVEVATWIPNYALKHIEKNFKKVKDTDNETEMQIVINVYFDDIIFQELSTNQYIINSRIIEVTIPGYSTNIEFSIPLVFRQTNHTILPKVCGYWDFNSDRGNIPGAWSKNGCVLLTSIHDLIICECYHLTHFGQLINIYSNKESLQPSRGEEHRKALNVITLIGSSLSLLGIVGIWLTAIVFDTWRKKTGTKVLLQLSMAIALPLILIILFNVDNAIIVENNAGIFEIATNMKIACITLGSLFHYSILANFNWMLITAILQFIRYVRVLGVSRPSRFLLKVTFIGWGLPIVPVSVILLIDCDNYIPYPSYRRTICYPSGVYMIIGVVVPICIILAINIILFVLVIKAISKKSQLRITDRSLVCAQFRLSVFLFFLLGLTWIFGIISFSGSVICSYLFCLTATIQGFVLFVYFVICDPTTRNSWITIIKPHFTSSRNSITTISSE
ncbi:hypothetical protein ACJJTC_012664 [Scirpophaga incertulas]